MFTGKTGKLSTEEKEQAKADFLRKRDRFEKKHLNGFELIHPLDERGANQEKKDEFQALLARR